MGSIEDSSGVPQVWQRRSEGSGTSHNAFSGNFWGDGSDSFTVIHGRWYAAGRVKDLEAIAELEALREERDNASTA